MLELFNDVQMGGVTQPVKVKARIGHGSGWKQTQWIIRGVGGTIVVLSWLAFLIVLASSGSQQG